MAQVLTQQRGQTDLEKDYTQSHLLSVQVQHSSVCAMLLLYNLTPIVNLLQQVKLIHNAVVEETHKGRYAGAIAENRPALKKKVLKRAFLCGGKRR